MFRLLLICCLFVAGCTTTGSLSSSGRPAYVQPPKDAAMPSTVSGTTTTTQTTIAPGTTISEGSPPQGASTPLAGATTEMVETIQRLVTLPQITSTQTTHSEQVIVAAPRQPDTSVELHKVDVKERRPLLYVGIALIITGIAVAALLHFPTPGLICAAAGFLCFVLWFISGETWLMYCIVGLPLLAGGLYAGYEVCTHHVKTGQTKITPPA